MRSASTANKLRNKMGDMPQPVAMPAMADPTIAPTLHKPWQVENMRSPVCCSSKEAQVFMATFKVEKPPPAKNREGTNSQMKGEAMGRMNSNPALPRHTKRFHY